MKRRTTGCWVTTVCLMVLAARTSFAERPPAPAPHPAEGAAPVTGGASAPDEVDAWFREASLKFEAMDYEGALPLLERACAASAFPGCALNLGAVHHALRHCAEARRHYEQYLRDEPQGERVAEARAALGELEPHCRSNAAAFDLPPAPAASSSAEGAALQAGVAPVAVAAPASAGASIEAAAPAVMVAPGDAPGTTSGAQAADEPRPVEAGVATRDPALEGRASYRPIAASMLILGGATGLTTLYLGVRLASANADFREHRAAAFDDQQRARLERSEQYQALTVGSGVASALLLGAGGVIWWLGGDSDGDAALAVSPHGLAGAQVSGRF